MHVSHDRITAVNAAGERPGPVLYWMSRDQRAQDNWALLHAQALALERKVPLAVVFCLVPGFLGATRRHYAFMLKGLEQVAAALATRRIPFFLIEGEPHREIPAFAAEGGAGVVVTDFDPLRIKQAWQMAVGTALPIPLIEVDAHNIVPCRRASPKLEFGAYTIRPRIRRLLGEFLTDFPRLRAHPVPWKGRVSPVDWPAVLRRTKADPSVPEVTWLAPGEAAAVSMLQRFLCGRLQRYHEDASDPMADGESELSPYLHFGQISAQRVALAVEAAEASRVAKDAFLEQLIVRRELSDNFCLHNPHYDSTEGFPTWARTTLALHAKDVRPYVYSRQDFEAGRTHDPLWNAAQMEMVNRGKMHNYMRMYWAKKILEWTRSPAEALATVLALNDRYELDGRDPNGYAGAAWSVGGVHDRAWGERPVFGKIRFMSQNGCRGKFDAEGYIQLHIPPGMVYGGTHRIERRRSTHGKRAGRRQ